MPSIFDTPTNPEPEPPPSPAPSDDGLRVGDVERQEALSVINDSYVAGRIDATELERRTAQAAAAVTRGDLRGATANLPGTQAIAQSFTSRLNELRADRQADEERRQKEAAKATDGAREAADAVARLFREFATSLKDAVPPQPLKTPGHQEVRKGLFSRPHREQIMAPPGYLLYKDRSTVQGLGLKCWIPKITVIVPDGRIWQLYQMDHIGVAPSTFRFGYMDLTPEFLFSDDYNGLLPYKLIQRAGRPFVATYNYETSKEVPLEDWLAEEAARIMDRWTQHGLLPGD